MPDCRTIVIFSTKGGVGKTFFASNLAVVLAKEEKNKVLLLDLDLQGVADMAKMFELEPQKTMADLLNLLKQQPPEKIKINKKDFLTSTKFGIDFLPAVLNPQQTPHIQPEKIKDIFALFESDYDYIVVDAGKAFSESLIQTFNQANLILLVVTPDILAIYQTKWALDTLQFLHFPLRMVKLILNRAEAVSSLSWQEVTLALPCDIIARIPSEGKTVMEALNRGIPVVVNSPRSKVSSTIKKFSRKLVTQEGLFIERKEIDAARLKELTPKQHAEFWRKTGMVETLKEPLIEKEEQIDELLRLKRRIHKRLIEDLKLKRLDLKTFSDPKKTKDLRQRAERLIANLLLEEAGSFISSLEVRQKLVKEILDEALGLGPLEDLLADPDITDIMVNNKDEVYIERHGKIELTSKKFISNEQVRTVIERIIAPIGRHIDESLPMVDARLPDGSRVNAVIPPLSLTGPTLTIRKFRKESFTAEELIDLNSLSPAMVEFLKSCVYGRKNMIVSGGTGSGKTTVLNVLSAFIPQNERIVTIEDAAELKLRQEHWIRMESRPPNIEGKGGITIRELFRNTLRMRPDRVIIGECRGQESLDMLQAMNTGHDGSMTTLHANSTGDVLARLDSMILMSGAELPMRAIREMVASAIDLIVHTARLSDGSRKIIQITEVAGLKDEIHVGLKDIFTFSQSGMDSQGKIKGDFKPTGYIPSFFEDMKIKGIAISKDLFK